MDLRPPCGIIPPQSIIPPLDDLQPLPKLTVFPARVATPVLLLEDIGAPYDESVAMLIAKVQAEDERMRRLLPAAPHGMRWEAELQSQDPAYNFTLNRADLIVRLVYKLKEI